MPDFIHEYWLTSRTIWGALHFFTAALGLILGAGIILLRPGSKLHKTVGYVFIPVLLIADISALFVHEMGMRFGPFHYLIPFSLFFLFWGMKPFIFKTKDKKKRIINHIRGMVGAALGLWAAFFAELIVRTPALSQRILPQKGDPFWISTIEGFGVGFIFMFIIGFTIRYQIKRMGLDK